MKDKTNIFCSVFHQIGKDFEQKYKNGFTLRKPKKIIAHTKEVLRIYRLQTSLNVFEKLSAIILIWRYVKMSHLPIREMREIERVILRGFHFMLGDATTEDKDKLMYLVTETGPGSSVMGPGNPLGHILRLKLLELDILNKNDLSIEERDKLESQWKELYINLSRKFRFRILNPI